jgi:hypothetical protein
MRDELRDIAMARRSKADLIVFALREWLAQQKKKKGGEQ